MNIASLCERDIVTVPASASVRQAAMVMRDQHVGALAVTLRTGIVREGSRIRGPAQAESQPPRGLYIARNEP